MLVALKTWEFETWIFVLSNGPNSRLFFPNLRNPGFVGSKLGNLDVKKSEWTKGSPKYSKNINQQLTFLR
jgi:hypothetical protein